MLLNNVSKEIYRFTWKRLLLFIGVGRFRILGGGANFQQAHDVVRTSMRRNDVASTSFRRHVPTRFLWNQCQIITFLILKSDIIVDYWGGAKAMLAPPQIIGGPGPPAPPPLPTPMLFSAFQVYGISGGVWVPRHDLPATFTKRNNFCDFLFSNVDDKWRKTCWSKIFSLTFDHHLEWRRKWEQQSCFQPKHAHST